MTSSSVEIFHRKTLAETMAKQLLTRSVSYDVRDGLFLSSGPGTGKTTFLKQDLIPVLQACGAHVLLYRTPTAAQEDFCG